jgi:hypothetical protein
LPVTARSGEIRDRHKHLAHATEDKTIAIFIHFYGAKKTPLVAVMPFS